MQSKLIKVIKSIDKTPYTLQLNYKNRQQFKSKTGGFLALLFYLGCVAIVAISVQSYITHKTLIYEQVSTIDQLTPIWLNQTKVGLLITLKQNGKDTKNITADNITDFNLSVYAEETDMINGTVKKLEPAIPCTDYNKTNNMSEYIGYFCFPRKINLVLFGRSDIFVHNSKNDSYHRVGLFINKTNASKQLNFSFSVKLKFTNLIITVDKYQFHDNDKQGIFYIKDGLPIKQNQMHQLTLYFTNINAKTDYNVVITSLNPWQQNYTFYNEESSTLSLADNSDIQYQRIVWVKFKRSEHSTTYNRYVKKLPALMGEIFGLIGLIAIIFVLVSGYNKWRFTQNQLVPERRRIKPNILKYYKQCLVNLFTNNIRYESSFESDFEDKLDVDKLLRTIQMLEERITSIDGGAPSSSHYKQVNMNQSVRISGADLDQSKQFNQQLINKKKQQSRFIFSNVSER